MTEDFRAEELLFMTKQITLDITAQMEHLSKNKDLSGVQAYLMVYILRHHPKGTYLTELSHEIGLSKSTLSVLMKKLKEKGYIKFRESSKDTRKKKVLPAAKLVAEGDSLLMRACQMETEIYSTLDQQEKIQLWNLEQKLLAQLKKMERDQIKKVDRRIHYREKNFTTA